MTSVIDNARANVDEIAAVTEVLDSLELDALVSTVLAAPRVFVTGVGRSGLMGRAVAMRLMHLGLQSFVVGEVATPAINDGDLLVAISSSGRGSVVEQARAASRLGATVVAVTAVADGPLHDVAHSRVRLPVRSSVPTHQHAGSLFEQCVLVVGDALCRTLQDRLGVGTEAMNQRHANLS